MKKRCGILQQKQQGNVGRSSSSSALWLSEDKGRNEDVPSVVEKRRKTGKLGSKTTLVNVISHQHEITVVRGKMKLRWETKIPNCARRKVLNLCSDILLARKKIILMLGSECRKRIANFRNEGLKNQESLGKVEGSENWKRIALPKLPLLRNSTFGRVLAAFRGVRSFCLLPKPI